MEDRTHKIYTDEDVAKITDTYHQWRKKDGTYEDIKGFCKSAPMEEVKKHGFVLTPGRYVGIPDAEDDGVLFEDKMKELTSTLKEQMAKEQESNEEIKKQLKKVGFEI